MSAPLKEVLLVGFGAVGAIYSFILKRSGLARVTAVARGNFDIVNAEGVHFQSRKYGNINGWRPDRLCKSVLDAADRQYSYVVITTKAIPELTKTPEILSPLMAKAYTDKFSQPTYVLMQNGLNVEVDLFNALSAANLSDTPPSLISTAVWIGTNLKAPNIVEHNDFDRVTLGVYRHRNFTALQNTTQEEQLLQDFGRILETGGTTITIVPEIQRMKFAKNFWNVAFASFASLTGYTLPSIFRPPQKNVPELVAYTPFVSPTTADLISTYTIPAIKGTLEELLALGRALGFPDSPEGSNTVTKTLEATAALHAKADSTHVPSMLLDVRKGQPIEVEVILGEVVRMAQERGVSIPRVEMLYALLLVVQNQILCQMEKKA